jgi:exopolysaccharide biosynthesis predicted pyruvyltransferase EpsI
VRQPADVCGEFVEHMRAAATERLRPLFSGVSAVHLADFPDYANVGDSAIALGLIRFFREEGIELYAVDSAVTIDFENALEMSHRQPGRAIVITGGGNLGDLYPRHQMHRVELLRRADTRTTLVQAPQSAHYRDADEVALFAHALSTSHADVRIGARDTETQEMFPPDGRIALVPDSAHILGTLSAPKPRTRVVRLLRRDLERDPNRVTIHSTTSLDWRNDPARIALQVRAAARVRSQPGLRGLVVPGPRRSESIAHTRVAAGLVLLAQGEIVITDRLHALILALHIGRRVVYIDNATQKLSRYAQLWFPDSWAGEIRRADSVEEAEDIVRHWK